MPLYLRRYAFVFMYIIPAFILLNACIAGGDYFAHILFASEAAQSGRYPPHFLFHVLLNFLTGFSGNTDQLQTTSIVVLTAALVIKMWLSAKLMDHLNVQPKSFSIGQLALLCTALFFAGPIINWWQFPIMLKGQFSPNIWHNPTNLMLMPFALGIFMLLVIHTPGKMKRTCLGSLLLAISILIKPNFALILIPVIIVLTFARRLSWKAGAVWLIPAIMVLGWQFVQNYTPSGEMTIAHHKSNLFLKPLTVWLSWTHTPFGSLIVSFAFPMIFTACFYRQIHHRKVLNLAWGLMASAMIIFLLFGETDHKLRHGNFFWGTIPALYILFLVTMVELAQIKLTPGNRSTLYKWILCYFFLDLHVASGVFFFIRNCLGNSYYS